MKTTLMLVASLGSALAAAPAFASDASRSVEVRYGDLNLATDKGVATLDRRIKSAATQICGDPYSRDLAMRSAVNHCRVAAVESTRVQVAEAITAAQRGQAYAALSGGMIAVSH